MDNSEYAASRPDMTSTTARVLPPTTARTGWDLSRRCCAASASLSCPVIAPQYVQGMLIQLDGSYHRWLGDHSPPFTLLLAVDDATGSVVNALAEAARWMSIQTSVLPAIKGQARTIAGNPLPPFRYVLSAQSHPVMSPGHATRAICPR